MLKRALFCLLLLSVMPVGAQTDEANPLAWIPADFAGFINLQIDDTDILTALNLATFVASFLQPDRITFQRLPGLEATIPLTQLDIEDASFNTDIFPWLDGEVIVAYQQFGRDFQVDNEDTVLILPTTDTLQAASNFSRIIQAQDKLARETYRDQTLYLADKTTIVFAPGAVLVGPTDLVKAMLDVEAGVGERLINEPAYATIATATRQSPLVSGYIKGEEALRALSVLIEGDESAMPFLQNLDQASTVFSEHTGLERLVLGNQLDGVGFTLEADTLRINFLRLTLMLYDAEHTAPVSTVEFNPDVLNLLPQNALVVHSGTDTSEAFYTLLTTLPLANFAGQFLGAFPVEESFGSSSGVLDVPDAGDIERVVGGFLSVLGRQANFDLDHDLLQHVGGSYTLALLPRPNDPLPPLNMAYDVLFIAEVEDAGAAQASATRLAQILLDVDQFDIRTIESIDFQTYQPDPIDEPVLHIGVVDNLLLVATGGALDQSLDAWRGDNRLVSRDRWQAVSDSAVPQLYLDIPAVYSTFLPQLVSPRLQQIKQLGARADYLGEGLFEVTVLVMLPSQLG